MEKKEEGQDFKAALDQHMKSLQVARSAREEKARARSEAEDPERIRARIEALRREFEALLAAEPPDRPAAAAALQALQLYYNEVSYALTNFHLRLYKEQLAELDAKLKARFEQAQPRPKFAFKSRPAAAAEPPPAAPEAAAPAEAPPAPVQYKCGQKLRLGQAELKETLTLEAFKDSEIAISGTLQTLYMKDLVNCSVACGVIETSLFGTDLRDCRVSAVAQQVRVHRAANVDFAVFVTSHLIIEDSTDIRVRPLSPPALDALGDWRAAVKDAKNNWRDVKDFNWIQAGQSPNVRYLDS